MPNSFPDELSWYGLGRYLLVMDIFPVDPFLRAFDLLIIPDNLKLFLWDNQWAQGMYTEIPTEELSFGPEDAYWNYARLMRSFSERERRENLLYSRPFDKCAGVFGEIKKIITAKAMLPYTILWSASCRTG
jgi:hypothetical protein